VNLQSDRMSIMLPHLKYNARFLQQICPHVRTNDVIPLIKADLNVFPKSTAIVIPGGLGVTDGLEMGTEKTSV